MIRNRLLLLVFFSLIICLLTLGAANAEEVEYNNCEIRVSGFDNYTKMFDSNRGTYVKAALDSCITLESLEGINGIYIEFDLIPEEWLLTDSTTGNSEVCGKYGFLHEYIDVVDLFGEGKNALDLEFPEGVTIADIYVFSEGELPEWVQKWNTPCEEADLMLISSHSDDEQLFFAGVLPYYAIERKLEVQVVYIVQHFEVGGIRDHKRPHEQLDGLWTVGVRNYPVMSDFPDVYSESKNRETAFAQAEKAFGTYGITYDDFCEYITGCIRRFKPLVIVSHDLNGEYGHGTHVFCASAVTEAVEYAGDSYKYPESCEEYGSWQVEKTYLHLYKENQIAIDWDTPYESMGGLTPFQITQKGFDCHKSQHYTWFNNWLNGNGSITKASQIKYYSPCEYGLYRTTVGEDTQKNDFMENIIPYSQRKAEKTEEESKSEATHDTNLSDSDMGTKGLVVPKDSAGKTKSKANIKLIITAVSFAVLFCVLIIVFAKVSVNNKMRRRRRR